MNGSARGMAWWRRILPSGTPPVTGAAVAHSVTDDSHYLWLLPGDTVLTAPGSDASSVPASRGFVPS